MTHYLVKMRNRKRSAARSEGLTAQHPMAAPRSEGWTKRVARTVSVPVILAGVVLTAIALWSYWPTVVQLRTAWDREADYSHGYLVVPFAAYLAWARRDRFPGRSERVGWAGLGLIAVSIALRYASAKLHIPAYDGWSIPIWVAGVTWLLAGWRVFWWSAPCIAFLWFMVPLPWRAERWLSLPLQTVATQCSVWTLQILGQPAIAEGHTIFLNSAHLEVEQACSGLRVLVGITALAVAYVLMVRRDWWERLFLLVSVIPIALAANVTRIVATALLYQYVSDEVAKRFAHDLAGWAMIVIAAGLFSFTLWYLRKLFREEELVEVGEVLRARHR